MNGGRRETRRGPTADEVGHLFNLIGKAVWYLQYVEDALSTSIAVKIDFKDARLGSISSVDAVRTLAKRRRLTLGQAVEAAKKDVLYDDVLQERLKRFLDERNWLVHRLVHESADEMNVNGKRERLLYKIEQIAEEDRNIQVALFNDLENFVVSKGASRDQLHETGYHEFLRVSG